jgi:hypothetical protein
LSPWITTPRFDPPHWLLVTYPAGDAASTTHLGHKFLVLLVKVTGTWSRGGDSRAITPLCNKIDFTIFCKVTCLTAATTHDIGVKVTDLRTVVFPVADFTA